MISPHWMVATIEFLVLVASMVIWHFWGIDAGFYFLFAVHFLEFVFSVGESFDEYDSEGF